MNFIGSNDDSAVSSRYVPHHLHNISCKEGPALSSSKTEPEQKKNTYTHKTPKETAQVAWEKKAFAIIGNTKDRHKVRELMIANAILHAMNECPTSDNTNVLVNLSFFRNLNVLIYIFSS